MIKVCSILETEQEILYSASPFVETVGMPDNTAALLIVIPESGGE